MAAAHEESKIMEPPETPAAVFAIRALKSAFFGTPGADDDEDQDPTLHERDQRANQNLHETNALLDRLDLSHSKIDDLDPPAQPLASPTKSILVTPGTATNRRKTVSFGEGVLEKERKDDEKSQRPKGTPVTITISNSQWDTSQLKARNTIRSRLTQSLINARDNSSKAYPRITQPTKIEEPSSFEELPEATLSEVEETDEAVDITVNLDEPRSESGKYWRTEFENYRQKTNREMKKLIQYRSAAKSYARKKDAEALRLAEKLKEEEAKVSEMERHVASLASTMVGGTEEVNKEQLVEELTKQTALAVQFKHKANTLRKVLQRHGVIGSDEDPSDGDQSSGQKKEKIRKQADKDLNLSDRDEEIERLKEIAQVSERKASNLEKENLALKQTLARVKQEMNKYEGRRKEKEEKLKHRESKLETKNAEYREKLKALTRERRDTEDSLKQALHDERKIYQEQIEALKNKLANMESSARTGSGSQNLRRRRDSAGVYVQDFPPHLERSNTAPTGDLSQLESSGPSRRQTSYPRQPARHSFQEARNRQKYVPSLQTEAEPLIYFDDPSPTSPRRRSLGGPGTTEGAVLAPPPPALRVVENAVNVRQGYPGYQRQYHAFEPARPSMVTFPAISGQMEENMRRSYAAPHHLSRKSAA